jgi:hypothetical protein
LAWARRPRPQGVDGLAACIDQPIADRDFVPQNRHKAPAHRDRLARVPSRARQHILGRRDVEARHEVRLLLENMNSWRNPLRGEVSM